MGTDRVVLLSVRPSVQRQQQLFGQAKMPSVAVDRAVEGEDKMLLVRDCAKQET